MGIAAALKASLLSGLPIWVCLSLVSLLFMWSSGVSLHMLVSTMYAGVDQYALIAVTGFLLVAILFDKAGIAQDLIKMVERFLRSSRSGLAVVTIASCAVFAAISSSGPATVTTIGGIMIPSMIRSKYTARFAGAVASSGGALGILIPPSVLLILYGAVAGVSTVQLYEGAIIPGLILSGMYALYTIIRVNINPSLGPPLPKEERDFPVTVILKMLATSVLPIALLIFFVLGSILTGWAAPTETSACGGLGEVRYQRSRSKARPASRKDSLGPKDLDGNVFYEPTQELKFVGNLTGGHFSVLLVPTAIAEVQRWQIFAENSITGRMDSYNVERSEDGLFNMRGSQTYTCADHPQVYTRKAGTCPECGKTLTLRLIDKGFSESAMKFDGVDDFVKLVDGVKLEASFTQEVWLLPSPDIDDKFHGFLGSQPEDKANCHRPPSVWVYQKGKIHAGFGDGVYWNSLITKDDVLIPGKWNHVAVTFDGKEYQVYVNGEKKEYDVSVHKYDPPEPVDETGFAGKTPCGTPIQFIGKVDNYFQGVIDDSRSWLSAGSASATICTSWCWKRARTLVKP